MSIKMLNAVLPDWTVDRPLTESFFGSVYKVVREVQGVKNEAVVKVISIPQNENEISEMQSKGMNEEEIRTHFSGIVSDFIDEIKLMQSQKGSSNIAIIEEYKMAELRDKIGWVIFVRMEPLVPLSEYALRRPLTEEQIIWLGKDICSALEFCASKGIIHRDIKSENIYISGQGHFKLGDFGLAGELERASGSLQQADSYSYIAPEVAKEIQCDVTVDVYSLGLVLYKLLNNNKLPFLEINGGETSQRELQDAILHRLEGNPISAPMYASQQLANVILKACGFDPAHRFQSATEFKNALNAVLSGNAFDALIPAVNNAPVAIRDSAAPVAATPAIATTVTESSSNLCVNCGTSALPDDVFCMTCGTKFEKVPDVGVAPPAVYDDLSETKRIPLPNHNVTPSPKQHVPASSQLPNNEFDSDGGEYDPYEGYVDIAYKSKAKPVIITILVILLLAAGGFAFWHFDPFDFFDSSEYISYYNGDDDYYEEEYYEYDDIVDEIDEDIVDEELDEYIDELPPAEELEELTAIEEELEEELPLEYDGIDYFVIRLYEYILGRTYYDFELEYWTNALRQGATGTMVAHELMFSDEFISREVSNDEFVDILYRALLAREPDEGGFNHWVHQLYEGLSREEALFSFADSPEFINQMYGIGVAFESGDE